MYEKTQNPPIETSLEGSTEGRARLAFVSRPPPLQRPTPRPGLHRHRGAPGRAAQAPGKENT